MRSALRLPAGGRADLLLMSLLRHEWQQTQGAIGRDLVSPL
jgi:hypothetical protein